MVSNLFSIPRSPQPVASSAPPPPSTPFAVLTARPSFAISYSRPSAMAYQYSEAAASSSNLRGAPTTPYGSGDPYYNESSGYIAPIGGAAKKRGTSPWIKFGIPLLICVIIAAVVGGVVGSRAHHNDSSASSAAAASPTGAAAASSAASAKEAIGVFATGTDSLYMLPLYPSTVRNSCEAPFDVLLINFRPTLLPSLPRLSNHKPQASAGPPIPSSRLTLRLPKFAPTALVSLPPSISGTRSPNSSRTSRT